VPGTVVCKEGDGQPSPDNNLPLGAFVTPPVTVQLDTAGSITGYCDWYFMGYYSSTQRRDISTISIETKAPSTAWTYYNAWNFITAQSLDTRNGGSTSGPDSLGVLEEGEFQLKFTIHAASTECFIPTDSPVHSRTINAVACLPRFVQFQQGPWLTQFPQDGTPLRVVYEPGLSAVVISAFDAWKSKLLAAGLTNFDYDTVDISQVPANVDPCDNRGGNCVWVGHNLVDCADSSSCGCSRPGNRSNGVRTTLSTISIQNSSWSASFKTWVVEHELGHLFGLDDATQCDSGASVMTTSACNSAVSASPTQSDAIPVAAAVYQGGSLKTCGW
jgi:hypothetical protein